MIGKKKVNLKQLLLVIFFIVILSSLAIFVAGLVYFGLNFSEYTVDDSQAQEVVDTLANAADYAYSMGPCFMYTVEVQMPEGVVFTNVSGNTIQMQLSSLLGETDVFASTEAELTGTIPSEPGTQQIAVAHNEDGKILFGDPYFFCSSFSVNFSTVDLPNESEEPALSVSTTSLTKNFVQGESGTDSFTITNTGDVKLTDISFEITGDIADMVTVIQTIDSLDLDASETITLEFSVPPDKPANNYPGILVIRTSDNTEYSITITVFVTKLGSEDTEPPTTSSVSHFPSDPTTEDSVTIITTGDDSTSGESTISLCQIELDNSGVWSDMSAVDGSYDETIEEVTYNLGTLGSGSHTVKVRCIDSENNVGSSDSDTFSVTSLRDVESPMLLSLDYSPNNPTTSDAITITATGDDSTTGGSTVSICGIQLDSSGVWSDMNAVDGTYDEVIEDITYNLGTLGEGDHVARARCTDSSDNTGSASISETFTVTQLPPPDEEGPIVTSVDHSPTDPTTADSVTITATGSDSTTGGNTIQMCELELDNSGVWTDMTAVDGSYDEITEDVTYSLGTLSLGSHTAKVRCTDSETNTGSSNTDTFSVSKDILFITDSASPSSDEQLWITWIDGHSSAEGFDWDYDQIARSSVTGGLDLTPYTIIVMANYPNSDATLDSILSSYRNPNYIVFLGESMLYGPQRLGDASTEAGVDNKRKLKVQTSHYVTTGYTIGNEYSITSGSRDIYYHDAFTATNILTVEGDDNKIVVGEASYLITHGSARPDKFNSDGDTFATRVLDHALQNS